MNIQECLTNIQNELNDKDALIRKMEAKNSKLTKALASIRQSLERAVKNPNTLNDTVYASIDLCRANLIYMDYSTGLFKMDAPLTDNEKVLS